MKFKRSLVWRECIGNTNEYFLTLKVPPEKFKNWRLWHQLPGDASDGPRWAYVTMGINVREKWSTLRKYYRSSLKSLQHCVEGYDVPLGAVEFTTRMVPPLPLRAEYKEPR